MALIIDNLSMSFGDLKVIENLNLVLESKLIHCMIGPSGAGKTTLLNLISGICKPTAGNLKGIEGERLAYLFQEDRLLPWATVEENIRFVLRSDRSELEVAQLVDHYLDVVELVPFKGNKPNQLSGGMKQRVALARAFAYGGAWLVMDEPFKGLDHEIKQTLMDYVVRLCREEQKSLIYVTHDIQEAQYMADQIHEFKGLPLEWVKTYEIKASSERRRALYAEGTQVSRGLMD